MLSTLIIQQLALIIQPHIPQWKQIYLLSKLNGIIGETTNFDMQN